jgi:antitoxin component HigA of HigAB toxin-antitoxin module
MSLENRLQNEKMRHVPSIEFMLDRIEREYARQLRIVAEAIEEAFDAPERAAAETELLAACRWMIRAAECATHSKLHPHPPAALHNAVAEYVRVTVEALQRIDGELFRRRMPYHRFERSEGEAVYLSFTAISFHLQRAIETVSRFDRAIYEKLFGVGLDRLRPEMLQPIA